MIKKLIIFISITFILISIILIIITYVNKKIISEKQIKTIPEFQFLDIHLNQVYSNNDLDKSRSVFFIYFNSECESCVHETEQLIKNIESFKDYQILMISIEEPSVLNAFSEKYNLSEINNLHILYDKELSFEKIYGRCPLPSVFIYNKEATLVKYYYGKVKIKTLLKNLNQ